MHSKQRHRATYRALMHNFSFSSWWVAQPFPIQAASNVCQLQSLKTFDSRGSIGIDLQNCSGK
jgi:hypothetical protein